MAALLLLGATWLEARKRISAPQVSQQQQREHYHLSWKPNLKVVAKLS